jgi:hypothetical protein
LTLYVGKREGLRQKKARHLAGLFHSASAVVTATLPR